MMTVPRNEASRSPEELADLLRAVVVEAAFDIEGLGTCSASQFREIYYQNVDSESDLMLMSVANPKPQVPEGLLAQLTGLLRILLEQYILDDRIGHSLHGVSISNGSPVPSLALDLVRAAAILGPEQATSLIWGWANGEPVPYQTCAFLSGLSVEHPLQMPGGIRFVSLPNRPDPPVGLPTHPAFDRTWALTMRAVKVTIDCEMRPALYKPEDMSPPDSRPDYGSIEEHLLATLCEALSLTCNDHVSWTMKWVEYGDINAFGRAAISRIHRSPAEGFSFGGGTQMTQLDMEEGHALFTKRLDDRNNKRGLDLAISRWRASKLRPRLADKFIELRIALEALYLGDNSGGEKAFRVAFSGAWHLGADYEQRRKYRKTLYDAYHRASRSVHAGKVDDSEKNRKLLIDAQDLCRQGILKRLYESEEPNWNELILGKEDRRWTKEPQ